MDSIEEKKEEITPVIEAADPKPTDIKKKEEIAPVIETAAPQSTAPQVPRKKKGAAGKIVALAICCTLVGGIAGAAGMAAYYHLSGNRPGRDRTRFEQMMKDGNFDPDNLPEDFDFKTRPGSKNNDQDSQANTGSGNQQDQATANNGNTQDQTNTNKKSRPDFGKNGERPDRKTDDQNSSDNGSSGSNKTRKKPGQRKTDQDNSNQDGQAQGAQDKSEG